MSHGDYDYDDDDDDHNDKNVQVGLPAKSGVSGSLVLVVPGVMGVTTYFLFCFLLTHFGVPVIAI